MPLISTRTNNGSRHLVRPLHGGNDKILGGLVKILKVKDETSKFFGKNGETCCLQYFDKFSEDDFQEFNIFLTDRSFTADSVLL